MSWRRALERAAAPIVIAHVALLVFAILEAAWTVGRAGVGPMAIARGLLLGAALAAPVAIPAGIVLAAIQKSWPGRGAPRLGVVVGVPIAATLFAVFHSGAVLLAAHRFHDPGLSAWAVALISLLTLPLALVPLAAVSRWLLPLEGRFPRASSVAVPLLGASALALVWWTPTIAFVGAAIGVAWLARPFAVRVSWRQSLLAGIVGVLVATSPLCNDELAFEAHRDGGAVGVPTVVGLLALALDWDRDGALAVMGGGDCDEGDASIGPEAIEVAGDGVDQDCRFGDQMLPPVAGPSPVRARRVLLISIDGLDLDERGELSPAMPALQARIAGGVRYVGSVGVAGRFRDVAPVLTDGVIPLGVRGDHSGFSPGVDSIPALVARAGGTATLAAPKKILDGLATQFLARQTRAGKGTTAAIAAARSAIGARTEGRRLVWLHGALAGGREKLAATDRALAQLVSQIAGEPSSVVIVVGLGAKLARGGSVTGGPIAIVGADIEARLDPRPVGLYDVFPTLTGLLELEPASARVGESLLASPDRAGAIGGEVSTGVVRLLATDGPRWVQHQPARRRFVSSAGGFDDEAGGPEAVRELAAELRGSALASRHARRNRARALSFAATLPADLDGTPTVIARALTVHGCTATHRGDDHVEVRAFMSGGDALDPDDLLLFKLSSAHRGSTRGRLIPGGGSRPFGHWGGARLVVETLDLDVRRLRRGTATLWMGVERDGKPLAVTAGSGSTPTWGRVCAVEVP